MDVILAVATILGGIAAVWFFIDKGRTIKWKRPVFPKTDTENPHTSAAASVAKFPLEVIEAVERLLPGYRLPQLQDIIGGWAE